MDGEPGFDNEEAANSAITGAGPAFGGKPRPLTLRRHGPGQRLLRDEVRHRQRAAGGRRAEEALGRCGRRRRRGRVQRRAPRPARSPGPGTPPGDEKGSGGGGGGGSLEILALGSITFGPTGQIVCRGGSGGGGENTIFLNRVGGGSGGGSGGHVILQTASAIDFTAVTGPTPPRRSWPPAARAERARTTTAAPSAPTRARKRPHPTRTPAPRARALRGPLASATCTAPAATDPRAWSSCTPRRA